jgi:hypothetical protein
VANDLVSKFVLKQSLQLTSKTHPKSPFCLKQTNCDMFWFSIQGQEINDRAKVLNAPLFIHKSNVAVTEIVALIKGKKNS